ncbi:transposase [Desulforhopalus singaporensis]
MSASICRITTGDLPECPRCAGQDLWRAGVTGAGKQQWRCKSCGRVFVIDPYINGDIKMIADRMLREGFPVPQVAVVLDGFVSRRWLYQRKKSCQW